MPISNRTVTIKNVFASTAETNIPNPPVPGQSYRNTGLTAEEVGQGWPFKEIVDSAKFNEAMYEYTTICQQLEKYGFLPWSANTDYPAGGCALGSDGKVYQAKQPTGPSTSSIDPVTDTSHTYWDLFYYATVTANRALVSNSSGKMAVSSTTATELGYVHGVTSAIQTQINAKAADNAVVHLAGDETITGTKTIANNANPNFIIQDTRYAYNDSQSANVYWGIDFQDKNRQRIGKVEPYYVGSGAIGMNLSCSTVVGGIVKYGALTVEIDENGQATTQAPTPTETTTTTGKQIATTGWVNSTGNNAVHKTGDETIAGNKTFSSGIIKLIDSLTYNGFRIQNTQVTKGTTPSEAVGGQYVFQDNTGQSLNSRLGGIETTYNANGVITTRLLACQPVANSTTYDSISVIYPASGNPYTEAPASDANNSIVTTINKSKAANGYFQLGNGLIIQWGVKSATTDNTTVTLPKAFTTTNYSVCATQQSSSDETRTNIATNTYTTTSFNLFAEVYERQQPLHWIAIGY